MAHELVRALSSFRPVGRDREKLNKISPAEAIFIAKWIWRDDATEATVGAVEQASDLCFSVITCRRCAFPLALYAHNPETSMYTRPLVCTTCGLDYLPKLERGIELRSMPYTQYLLTPEWKQIREEALDRARHKCQLCNSGTALQVHHRTYENRGREMPEDLTVLCANCHERFHDAQNHNRSVNV